MTSRGRRVPNVASELFVHGDAAARRIADQPHPDGIDFKIESFQRNSANKDGTIIRDFGDVAEEIPILFRPSHSAVDVALNRSVCGP